MLVTDLNGIHSFCLQQVPRRPWRQLQRGQETCSRVETFGPGGHFVRKIPIDFLGVLMLLVCRLLLEFDYQVYVINQGNLIEKNDQLFARKT